MDPPERKQLIVPTADEEFSKRVRRYSIPAPTLPPWPWQAAMFCALNCYLLWSLTWFQYLINTAVFTLDGRHLWFYTTSTRFFGLSLPEVFLLLSIVLSLFAFCAVIGKTQANPRLWKRILAVSIFASIAITVSCLSLHLRHYSYEYALFRRDRTFDEYHEFLTTSRHDGKDDYQIKWYLEKIEKIDSQIILFEEKYGLTHQGYREKQ